MPQTGLNMFRPILSSPPDEQALDLPLSQAPASIQKPQRHSMGVTFGDVGEDGRNDQPGINSTSTSADRPMSLQSSYSTNDLPTVKNSSGVAANAFPSKTHVDQQFHNHNASMGRIPPGAASNRQSRDFPTTLGTTDPKREEKGQGMQSLLQASAAPFGPHVTSTADPNVLSTSVIPYGSNMAAPSAYGYSMQTYNLSSNPSNNQLQTLQSGYGTYPTYGGYGRLQDNQTRVVHQRRQQGGNEAVRYDNVPIENYRGKLYELCKDQHGCRYLQKRLEEKNPEHTMLIFIETCPFVVELMTGNHAQIPYLLAANHFRPFRQLSLPETARVLR
jgi:Pumilio-family RNA binding repeat